MVRSSRSVRRPVPPVRPVRKYDSMTASRFLPVGFLLAIYAVGGAWAGAQETIPTAGFENTGSAPFRASGHRSDGMKVGWNDAEFLPPIVTKDSLLPVAVERLDDDHAVVPILTCVPPHPTGASAIARAATDSAGMRSTARILQVEDVPATSDDVPPAPLSPTDSAIFAESTAAVGSAPSSGDRSENVEPTATIDPRMPKMTKMFSFNTIDKVIARPTAPAVGPAVRDEEAELELDLTSPQSVVVNEVFQQLVRVQNAGAETQCDVRVTQICDLAILGADRYQAVTIDSLAPGETRTVRFSTRAQKTGMFSVRYVAENRSGQADIDETVRVIDDGITISAAETLDLKAGDAAETTIAIQNPTSIDLSEVSVRCRVLAPALLNVQLYDRESCVLCDLSSLELPPRPITARSTVVVGMHVASLQPGSTEIEVVVEASGHVVARKRLSVSVSPRLR